MPYPGQINNPSGANDFSGPLGETGPAYGTVEKEKVLTRAAPGVSPSPESAPRRAQRRAVRGKGGSGAPPSALGPLAQPHVPTVDAVAQQQAFWRAILMEPEASPLAKQYAQAALSNG